MNDDGPDDRATGAMVLIVDDDPDARALLRRWLMRAGHDVMLAADGQAGVDSLGTHRADVVLLDLEMPVMGGMDALRRISRLCPELPVVITTADRSIDRAVAAVDAGAYDYVCKPLERRRLLRVIELAVERSRLDRRVRRLEREVEGGYPGIVGRSRPMLRLFDELDRVGPADIPVLITGESGTGKELVARALHRSSPRSGGPFVAVNCAAVPPTMQESEFFGHERGAFTGAVEQRIGRLEQADGGTLLLDEVAELDLGLQAKLLRALQEQRFHRVGGRREIGVDVRVLCATHTDLAAAVEAGRFRRDLYFRLAVYELTIPPLRERGQDVALIARHVLDALAGDRPLVLDPLAREALLRCRWPGNVRELVNAMRRAAVVCHDRRVRLVDLPASVRGDAAAGTSPPAGVPAEARTAYGDAPVIDLRRPMRLADVERRVIDAALERNDGDVGAAARELGIGRSTLYRRLKSQAPAADAP